MSVHGLVDKSSFLACRYCLVFKTLTFLNSLKPCMYLSCLKLSLKPAVNASARLHEVGPAACFLSGGTAICLHLLQDLSLPCFHCCFCQADRMNYKFSGGDWATGQPKPFLETFASALLAGIQRATVCTNSQE